MSFLPVEEQLEVIRRGTVEIVPEDELVDKLKTSRKQGRPLKIKLGCDPTRPDLHLGHSVILRKLRQFQDLGHEAILIIGDFTAMIGDPTGQNETRPALSTREIEENASTYLDQATRILDEEKTTILYNSDWLGTMQFEDVIKLASKLTVARMIERDDFSKRFEANEPISLHEFLYPLAQGQDSVHLHSDVELGGSDQKFNLLVGRDLQKDAGQEPQICLMMPLLVGTDGSMKMSKSYDNYIGITEQPDEMYGKVLSIPDELIYPWFELITDVPVDELPKYKQKAEEDPRNAKHDLAFAIVQMYHGEEAAQAARQHFEKTVVQGDVPDDIETFQPEPDEGTVIGLLNLMKQAGLTQSNSQGRRMVKQNAVSIDGEKVSDPYLDVDLAARAPFVLKVGKRRYAQIVWDEA
ncbi:MAG: tyrosine--tRNA ligase [Balneolaceae bacterium]|nr:tyrosine--tRNA ligase [Balneolaceae bacterium]